jgi:orotidine-5'-phosphate decarboxylase
LDREHLQLALRSLPSQKKVITALDTPNADKAVEIAASLSALGGFVKVGMELFTRAGPPVVETLLNQGNEVFLDLKYMDIPNTVAGAVRSACSLGVSMITLHAGGGLRMLEAAAEAAAAAPIGANGRRPALLGVTVLTSFTLEELDAVQPGGGAMNERIARLAGVVLDSGCDGIVCSAADLPALRSKFGDKLLTVTPGIRPVGSDKGDQRRTTTPAEAVQAGADYLVIGRPITQASDPAAVLATISKEIEEA